MSRPTLSCREFQIKIMSSSGCRGDYKPSRCNCRTPCGINHKTTLESVARSRHRRVTALSFVINAQAAVANGDSSRAQKSQIGALGSNRIKSSCKAFGFLNTPSDFRRAVLHWQRSFGLWTPFERSPPELKRCLDKVLASVAGYTFRTHGRPPAQGYHLRLKRL